MSALNNKDCNYFSNKEIKITFDGKSYTAYAGDTIASALLRNNIRLIGRSKPLVIKTNLYLQQNIQLKLDPL